MARLKTHEEGCQRLLGSPHTDIHKWLDEYAEKYPVQVYFEYHRKFRHTEEALTKQFPHWNHQQQLAAKIHIIRDNALFVLTKAFSKVKLEEVDELFNKALGFCHSY